MSKLSIIERDGVTLILSMNGQKLWGIESAHLGETRDMNGKIVSNWILHLNEKNWITLPILYELGKIINNRFPDKNIDWESTFFPVEKRHYLDTVAEMKNEFEGNPEKSGFNDFIARVNLGQQENNEEVNEQILNIIRRNLDDYGIH